MDRLEAMSILLAAVETGSLSAAGRRLGIPLPTVSRKISELESHLNARLLTRSTRKLLLTDAGSSYVAACRSILEQVGQAERAVSGEFSRPRGELFITAPIVFGRLHIIPTVSDFLAQFPEIDIHLILTDRNVHLIDDRVDLALRIGALPDSSFVSTRIGDIRSVVCGSPGFFARHGVPKTIAELSKLPCVTFDSLNSPVSWSFRKSGTRAAESVLVHSRLTVNTAEAAIDAAVAGVGVTRVLSYQIEDAIVKGALQIVLEDFESESLPVNLVHAGQAPLPLKLRAFLDFAVPRLRKRMRYKS